MQKSFQMILFNAITHRLQRSSISGQSKKCVWAYLNAQCPLQFHSTFIAIKAKLTAFSFREEKKFSKIKKNSLRIETRRELSKSLFSRPRRYREFCKMIFRDRDETETRNLDREIREIETETRVSSNPGRYFTLASYLQLIESLICFRFVLLSSLLKMWRFWRFAFTSLSPPCHSCTATDQSSIHRIAPLQVCSLTKPLISFFSLVQQATLILVKTFLFTSSSK